MTFEYWLQIVGAVFAGCLLAGVFGFAFMKIWKDERSGGDGWHMPVRIYVLWTLPLAFLAGVIYSLT